MTSAHCWHKLLRKLVSSCWTRCLGRFDDLRLLWSWSPSKCDDFRVCPGSRRTTFKKFDFFRYKFYPLVRHPTSVWLLPGARAARLVLMTFVCYGSTCSLGRFNDFRLYPRSRTTLKNRMFFKTLAQLNLPVLLPFLLSHQCHQQSGGWWLFCLQCWHSMLFVLLYADGSFWVRENKSQMKKRDANSTSINRSFVQFRSSADLADGYLLLPVGILKFVIWSNVKETCEVNMCNHTRLCATYQVRFDMHYILIKRHKRLVS